MMQHIHSIQPVKVHTNIELKFVVDGGDAIELRNTAVKMQTNFELKATVDGGDAIEFLN